MDKILSYKKPIYSFSESKMNDDYWDTALEHYNNKRYLESFYAVMDYIDPDLRKNYGTDKGFSIPHGSIVVNIELSKEQLIINSPFISLADSKRVPLMRKLAEIKQHPLNLADIRLEGDEAHFHFACPIHNCEPYKLYNLLREICFFADMFDDEFIEKYNASHLTEPQVTQIEESVKEDAYLAIKGMLEESLEYFDHYMKKRWSKHAWYTLNIGFKRIEYYAQPQGFYRTELERSIDTIYDSEIPFLDRLAKGKAQLQHFLKYTEEGVKDALYTANTFVSHKYKGSIENTKEKWDGSYDDIKQMIANGNYEEGALTILSQFYNLFYYSIASEEIRTGVMEAMEQAQGKSWNEGSQILLQAMENVMEDNLDLFAGMGMGMDLSKVMEGVEGMDIAKAMEENMAQSMEMMQKMMQGMFNQNS